MESNKLLKVKQEIFQILKDNGVSISMDHNHWDGWCLVLEDDENDQQLWIRNNDL